MSLKICAFAFAIGLTLPVAAFAADYPVKSPAATFDYQGQPNLGLAPETPDDATDCRDQDLITDAAATDASPSGDQAAAVPTKPAPVKPDQTKKQAKTKPTLKTDKAAILSAANELERHRRKCGALTDAAMKTAGYIQGQAAVASGTNAAGLIAATAFVAGGAALAMGGSAHPNNTNPAPLPIPGAGFLSYLVMAMSAAAVWGKRQLQKWMRPIKQHAKDQECASSAI